MVRGGVRFFSVPIKALLILIYLSFPALSKTNVLVDIGNVTQVLNPLACVGAAYYFEDMTGFKQTIYSYTLNAIITYGLKFGLDTAAINKRPNGKYHNFPSGHTSFAMTGATVLMIRYGTYIAAIPMILVIPTAIGRVQSKNHTTAAAIGGVAVGALSAAVFTTTFSKYTKLQIAPTYTKDFKGLSLSLTF